MGTNGKGIILLGLGPGDPSLLTRQAWMLLNSISEVYVHTRHHPALQEFPDGVEVFSFDEIIEGEEDIASIFERMVTEVLELGQRSEGVVFGVPGHPFIAEATSPEIIRRAKEAGIPVKVIGGVSFVEGSLVAIGQTGFPHISIVDALDLANNHFPPFPPNAPVLIAQVYSKKVLAKVKDTLLALYPGDHPVQLVHALGTPDMVVETLSLQQLDQSEKIGWLTSLYLPPLGMFSSFEEFQDLIAHLRSPEGCPWDREQTHQTLCRNLIEEAYEARRSLEIYSCRLPYIPRSRRKIGNLQCPISFKGFIPSWFAAILMFLVMLILEMLKV
jgi:tetrapyrrole methylase family protein/MazG family protein